MPTPVASVADGEWRKVITGARTGTSIWIESSGMRNHLLLSNIGFLIAVCLVSGVVPPSRSCLDCTTPRTIDVAIVIRGGVHHSIIAKYLPDGSVREPGFRTKSNPPPGVPGVLPRRKLWPPSMEEYQREW